MTTKAIWKRVQARVGTVADGIPGRQTARAILAALGEPVPDEKPKGRVPVTGSGKNIKRIVIHCAATPEGKEFDVEDIRRWHKGQGWSDVGYHFVITLDGMVQRGRPESRTGSHVRGRNTGSIAICYIGGVDAAMKAKDTRTAAQKEAMKDLVQRLVAVYPKAKVLGHRDHIGVRKACPSFDAIAWWESVK